MWDFAQIWNDVLERPDNRVVEKRERIWASEIGGSMIDRYLKMTGTHYTNPPNSRSMRKFMAGNIWEWIVETVLLKAGILLSKQERLWYDPEGYGTEEERSLRSETEVGNRMLPVSGRLDFIAGGNPDWNAAKAEFENGLYPDFMKNLALGMIEKLQEKYPLGLEEKILEIKSCSSFMFEKYLATGKPNIHHAMQAYLYTQCLPYAEADVVYVCRDDVRILQFPIYKSDTQYQAYLDNDIKTITAYLKSHTTPEKENLICWDADAKKFTKNWKVEYSQYLSMLYSYVPEGATESKPFERPDEYADYIEPKVSAWNRVVKRVVEGKELTKSNQEYIDEMSNHGFALRDLLAG